MPQRIELFDGEIIEFDDQTPEEVIQNVVKRETLKKQLPGGGELSVTTPVAPMPGVRAVEGALTPLAAATGLPPLALATPPVRQPPTPAAPPIEAPPIQPPPPMPISPLMPQPPRRIAPPLQKIPEGELRREVYPEDDPYWLSHFNTELTPKEEREFQKWAAEESKRQNRNILMDLYTYDVRGFWKAKAERIDQHGPDTFKKPSHPTFSNQSMYHGVDGYEGGTWGEDASFTPGRTNLVWGIDRIRREFYREPDRPEHLIGEPKTAEMPEPKPKVPPLEPYLEILDIIGRRMGAMPRQTAAGGRELVRGAGNIGQGLVDLIGVLSAQVAPPVRGTAATPGARLEQQRGIQERIGQVGEKLSTEELVGQQEIGDFRNIKSASDAVIWATETAASQGPIIGLMVAGGLVAPESAPFLIGSAVETGLISTDIKKRTGEYDPNLPLLFGIPAGLLEGLPVSRLLTADPVVAKSFLGWLAKKGGIAARQAFREGSAEIGQGVLEEAAAEWAAVNEDKLKEVKILTPDGREEILWNLLNQGAAGLMMGTVLGGGGGDVMLIPDAEKATESKTLAQRFADVPSLRRIRDELAPGGERFVAEEPPTGMQPPETPPPGVPPRPPAAPPGAPGARQIPTGRRGDPETEAFFSDVRAYRGDPDSHRSPVDGTTRGWAIYNPGGGIDNETAVFLTGRTITNERGQVLAEVDDPTIPGEKGIPDYRGVLDKNGNPALFAPTTREGRAWARNQHAVNSQTDLVDIESVDPTWATSPGVKGKLSKDDINNLYREHVNQRSLEEALALVEREENFDVGPGSEFPLDRATRIAERRNARRKEAMSLYEGTEDIGGMTTPEEVKAEFEAHMGKMDALLVGHAAASNVYRKALESRLSREDYEFMLKERLAVPEDPTMSAEFWRGKAQERLQPGMFAALEERANRQKEAAIAAWKKGEPGIPPLAGQRLTPDSPYYKLREQNARRVPVVGGDENLVRMFAEGSTPEEVLAHMETLFELTDEQRQTIIEALEDADPETTDPKVALRQVNTQIEEYRIGRTAEELDADPKFRRLEERKARLEEYAKSGGVTKEQTPLQKMTDLHQRAEALFGSPVDNLVLHKDTKDIFVESPEKRGVEGWVRKDDPRYAELRGIYDEFAKRQAEQQKLASGDAQGDLGFGAPTPVAEMTPAEIGAELRSLREAGVASDIDAEATRQDRIKELEAELSKRKATDAGKPVNLGERIEEILRSKKTGFNILEMWNELNKTPKMMPAGFTPRQLFDMLEEMASSPTDDVARWNAAGTPTWSTRSQKPIPKNIHPDNVTKPRPDEGEGLLPDDPRPGDVMSINDEEVIVERVWKTSKGPAGLNIQVIFPNNHSYTFIGREAAQMKKDWLAKTKKKPAPSAVAGERPSFAQSEIGGLRKSGAGIVRDSGGLEVVYDNQEKITVEREPGKNKPYVVKLYRPNGDLESTRKFNRWPQVVDALQEHWKGVPTGEVSLKRRIQQDILGRGGIRQDRTGPYRRGTDEGRSVHPRLWAPMKDQTGQALDQLVDEYINKGWIPAETSIDEFIEQYLTDIEPVEREPVPREPTEADLEAPGYEQSQASEVAIEIIKEMGLTYVTPETYYSVKRAEGLTKRVVASDLAHRLLNARSKFDIRNIFDAWLGDLRVELADEGKTLEDIFESEGELADIMNRLSAVQLEDDIPFAPTEIPERVTGDGNVVHSDPMTGWDDDPAVDAMFMPDEEGEEIEDEEEGPPKGKKKGKKKPKKEVPYIPSEHGMVMEGPAGMFKSRVFRQRIINELIKAAKSVGGSGVIRVGRMGRRAKTARGYFDVFREIIRMAKANDYATAAHEFAHMIEKACFNWQKGSPFKKPLFNKTTREELAAVGRALYGSTKPAGGYMREGWAEVWRLWLENPDELAKIAPQTKAWIEEVFFEAFPESKKYWTRARKLTEEWMKMGAEERAANSMRDATSIREKVQRWVAATKSAFSPQGLWEMLHPFSTFTKEVEKKLGRELAWAEGPYNIARTLNKTQNAVVEYWVNVGQTNAAKQQIGPSLKQILAPLKKIKGAYKKFSIYLWARRTVALQSDPRHKPRASGMSLQDALYLVEHYEQQHPEFRTIAAQFYEWEKNVLLYAAEASPTFRQAVDTILAADPGSYVPLHRIFSYYDERYGRMGGRSRTGGAGDLVKKLEGSGRDVRPVIDTEIAQAVRIVRAAHEEFVLNRAMELAGVEGMGGWITPVPKGQELKTQRDAAQLLEMVRRAVWKEAGDEIIVTTEDRDGEPMDADEIENAWGDILIKIWGISDRKPAPGEVPTIPRIGRDGKITWYEVNPDLVEALTTFDPFTFYGKSGRTDFEKIVLFPFKLMEATTRTFRMGTTGLRATFGLITNPERDFQTLYLNTQSRLAAPKLFLHYLHGLRGSLLYNLSRGTIGTVPIKKLLSPSKWRELMLRESWQDPYVDFAMRWGGRMVQPLAQDVRHTARMSRQLFEGRVRRLFDVSTYLDFYRDIVQAPELAPRLAEIRALAAERGWDINNLTVDQAMFLFQAYSEVTTDFRAEGMLGRYGNRVIPFLNASIQGPRANLRAMKRKPFAFWFRGAQLTGLTMWLWWKNKDREWWKELPFREKYLFWYIPLNDDEDEAQQDIVRIPRAFEIGLFFSALPEALLDQWYNDDPEAVKQWFWTALATANPLDLPILAKLPIEIAANYDIFWQRNIESQAEALGGMPDYQKFGPYTSSMSIVLGRIFDVSPKKLDHIIKSIFGPVSMDLLMALSPHPGGVDREKELADMAIGPLRLGTQFKQGGAFGTRSRSIQRVFDEYDKAREKAGDVERPETEEEKIRRLLLDDARQYLADLGQIQVFTKGVRERRELQSERVRVAQEVLKIIDSKDPWAALAERDMLKPIKKMADQESKLVQKQYREQKLKRLEE